MFSLTALGARKLRHQQDQTPLDSGRILPLFFLTSGGSQQPVVLLHLPLHHMAFSLCVFTFPSSKDTSHIGWRAHLSMILSYLPASTMTLLPNKVIFCQNFKTSFLGKHNSTVSSPGTFQYDLPYLQKIQMVISLTPPLLSFLPSI